MTIRRAVGISLNGHQFSDANVTVQLCFMDSGVYIWNGWMLRMTPEGRVRALADFLYDVEHHDANLRYLGKMFKKIEEDKVKIKEGR